MYEQVFGLQRPLFDSEVAEPFFYEGGQRRSILEAVTYAIGSGEAITKIIGEPGSGKTSLCRALVSRAGDAFRFVHLQEPELRSEEIYPVLGKRFGISKDLASDTLVGHQTLHDYLVKNHVEGNHVVVIVDQAESMSLATLEELRLLSNLETQRHKLLQIVLVGRPKLDEKLARYEIRQLRERITNSFTLQPLDQEETLRYLEQRFAWAGRAGELPIDAGVIKRAHALSGGWPGRVNHLIHKALLVAHVEGVDRVESRHMRIVARDGVEPSTMSWKWFALAVVLGVLLIAGGLFLTIL
ncbi:MAG: AAA family ATPase [Magnetococcales bacterium]|nr:AAA family ATPase [Magnetococcales bacterium]